MTWSILVRDPSTGGLGAAVASKFFAVGAVCIHVEGGVGALSTQALINPLYAFQAMPRLRADADPAVVVGTARDRTRAVRNASSTSWTRADASASTRGRAASPGPAMSAARISPSPATCWPARP